MIGLRFPRAVATGVVATLVSFALATAAVSADVAPGKPAPDFTAVDSNGKSHTLSSLKGKTVVLEWTNHDCPYVRKHYGTGNMQATQKAAGEQGVVWLTVISSAMGLQGHVSPKQANELTVSRKATPAAVLLDEDGKVGRLYGARTTPHMFVIDPKGMIAYMGAMDDKPSANHDDVKTARNYVKLALSAVAANKPASPASTRPYGCSVKY